MAEGAVLVEVEQGSALDAARIELISAHWHDNLTPRQQADRDKIMRATDAWTQTRKRVFALVSPGASTHSREGLPRTTRRHR